MTANETLLASLLQRVTDLESASSGGGSDTVLDRKFNNATLDTEDLLGSLIYFPTTVSSGALISKSPIQPQKAFWAKGTINYGETGANGDAIRFSTTGYLKTTVGELLGTISSESDFTILFPYRPVDSTPSSKSTILGIGSTGGANSLDLRTNGTLGWQRSGSYRISGSTVLTSDTRHQVGIRRKDGVFTMFLDGAAEGLTSTTDGTRSWPSTDFIGFGTQAGGNNEFQDAYLEDVIIALYAWSDAQIAAHYDAGAFRALQGVGL